MRAARVNEIIEACTSVFRKGEVVVQEGHPGLSVTHVFGYPHVSEAEGVEMFDVHFVGVGVDVSVAEGFRDELDLLVREDEETLALVKTGPSYIALGAELGSQEHALRFFALAQALGFGKIITPALFGMTGEQADQAAGVGYVMLTGWSGEDLRVKAQAGEEG